jgi:hypothetical protein
VRSEGIKYWWEPVRTKYVEEIGHIDSVVGCFAGE